jgi:chemotaxis signal transduction protein
MREASDGREELSEQMLSFTAGGADYGIPILKVREILQYETVTEVPGAPRSVRGVANVRGAAVPVLDLGAKLGRGASEPTKRSCILVVEISPAGEPLTLGVFADAVNEVVNMPAREIEPPPFLGAGAKLSYLVGVGKIGKAFLLLVDLDRILTASEAEIAAEIAPSQSSSAC